MITDLIKFILFVYAACPEHCRQCQVNAASGSVECNANMCDNGYGIKESDKTCVGMHSYVYLSILTMSNYNVISFSPVILCWTIDVKPLNSIIFSHPIISEVCN